MGLSPISRHQEHIRMATTISPISPEQFATAYQSQLETLFALSQTAFSGIEKMVALNLNVAKANLQDSHEKAREMFSVKDPQELLAWNAQQLQPAAEKAVAFSKVAEAQLADANAKFVSMIDAAAKNAPAGSETAVAMMKSAVAAANSAYDSLSKAAKQAVEMTEANVTAATNAAVKTAGQAAGASRKKA
jgi:phasin family protein